VKTREGSKFGVHSIKEMDVSQNGAKSFSYVENFVPSTLANIQCDSSKANTTKHVCYAKIQLLASYFDQDGDKRLLTTLIVEGSVKLDYVGRRLSIDVPTSLVENQKLKSEKVDDVHEVDRRLLQGDEIGGFKSLIRIKSSSDITSSGPNFTMAQVIPKIMTLLIVGCTFIA